VLSNLRYAFAIFVFNLDMLVLKLTSRHVTSTIITIHHYLTRSQSQRSQLWSISCKV